MNNIIPNLKLYCSFMLEVLKFKGRLVCEFKLTFLHFKQYCTHFYTYFYSHVFQKILNNNSQATLPT